MNSCVFSPVLLCSLNFQFCPSSRVYGFTAVDLKPGGEDEVEEQTPDNGGLIFHFLSILF